MAKKVGQKRSKDARLNSEARRSRRDDDREVTENRELTEDPRLDEFRNSFYQAVLPDLPKIPGFHVCWLTTNNPGDSIARRTRLGYEPIHADEVPGYEAISLKTGEYAGCIGVNEMIAFKLPLHLYEGYMRYSHHELPLQEEQKLRAVKDRIVEEAAQVAKHGARGIIIEEEAGTAELGQDPGAPDFRELHGEV